MNWKDKLLLGFAALMLTVLLVMCAALDQQGDGKKVANVVGNIEIQKYDDDTNVCYLAVNKKSEDVSAISCLKK